MILSIIIPVYKVERFVSELLKSLLPQIDERCEIIFIDDGSPDNSYQIIKSETAKYKNIKIYRQENKGLSSARNHGIDNASGDYISFIDPDDFVSINYLEVIYNKIEEHSFDILTFNASNVNEEGRVISECTICSESTSNDFILRDVFNRGRWYAWARVYNKKLFSENRFPEGKRFEDLLTIPYLYKISENLISISDVIIHYRINSSGITRNPKESDLIDISEFTNHYQRKLKPDEINNEFFLNLLIYLSGVKTLFYISKDLKGVFGSIKYMKNYIYFNFMISNEKLAWLNRNNKIFMKLIFCYYLYYLVRK